MVEAVFGEEAAGERGDDAERKAAEGRGVPDKESVEGLELCRGHREQRGEGGNVAIFEDSINVRVCKGVSRDIVWGLSDSAAKGDVAFAAAVGGNIGLNTRSTSGFAKDGDALRIATEEADVLLHPVEGEALIEEAGVGLDAVTVHPALGGLLALPMHYERGKAQSLGNQRSQIDPNDS